MNHVDLNADMGESFGPWPMGDDAALMEVITSANIACGFHAGDPDVMVATMRAAVLRGIGIGAHPGLPDLQGFGRRRMAISEDEAANLVRYQLGAAMGMARAAGGHVQHLKLHGALSNMATSDGSLARACFAAALELEPKLRIFVLAMTPMQAAAEALGCNWVGEIFADRAYNDDATLRDRKLPGAVIHDPGAAARRMTEMVRAGAIITESGKHIAAHFGTICVHGDTAEAVKIARAVRQGLEDSAITVRSPYGVGSGR